MELLPFRSKVVESPIGVRVEGKELSVSVRCFSQSRFHPVLKFP